MIKMNIKQMISVVLLANLLSACTTFDKEIEPGEVITHDIVIDNPTLWSNKSYYGISLWTYDGLQLNTIAFYDVEFDEPIYKFIAPSQEEQYLVLESHTLDTASELYLDALTSVGITNIELLNQDYRVIGEFEATEIEFQYNSVGGLIYQELVLLVKKPEKGYTVAIMNAPQEYYFPKYESYYRKMLASVKQAPR